MTINFVFFTEKMMISLSNTFWSEETQQNSLSTFFTIWWILLIIWFWAGLSLICWVINCICDWWMGFPLGFCQKWMKQGSLLQHQDYHLLPKYSRSHFIFFMKQIRDTNISIFSLSQIGIGVCNWQFLTKVIVVTGKGKPNFILQES